MGLFASNVGDTLTICILTDDTHCIVYHSTVIFTLFKNEKNLCLEFSKGEDVPHKPVRKVLCTQDTESEEYETAISTTSTW